MNPYCFLLFAVLFANTAFCQHQERIGENRWLKNRNNKFGVTDSLDGTIVPFVYDFIEYKNKRLIVRKNGSHGLLTTNNEELVPVQYQFVLPRPSDRFILWTHNALFGLCDADGKIILPVKYIDVSSIANDDFYITKNEKKLNGVYDINGNPVLEEAYRFYTIDNYKIFALKNHQPQIIDLQHPGEILYLDKDINFIETQEHNSMGEQFYQIVRKQNKYGVINASNQVVVPLMYDEVRSSQNWRFFIIKQNNKVGLINVNGVIVKKPVYDAIELRKEYVLLRRKHYKDEIYAYEW